MAKYPRTAVQFLPYLQRIHEAWESIRCPPSSSLRRLQFSRRLIAVLALATVSLLVILACAAFARFTGVERIASQAATWEIIDEDGIVEIRLHFADSGNDVMARVVSRRFLDYLENNKPDVVTVTFKATYDFGNLRERGPILAVDEIPLND